MKDRIDRLLDMGKEIEKVRNDVEKVRMDLKKMKVFLALNGLAFAVVIVLVYLAGVM